MYPKTIMPRLKVDREIRGREEAMEVLEGIAYAIEHWGSQIGLGWVIEEDEEYICFDCEGEGYATDMYGPDSFMAKPCLCKLENQQVDFTGATTQDR